MNSFDDEMSTTNVSLIDESQSLRPTSSSKEQDYLRMGSLALKHQESTLDGLKKENFDLRLRLYFYEQRLSDMSSESIDKALKENVTFKITIQKLSQELKKYKTMILELNQAIDILKNTPCPKQHGMSDFEKQEMERIKAEAEGYHDENDKLSRMMADLSSENVRLRSTIRSRNTSTTTDLPSSSNSTHSNNSNEEFHDLSRKYRQAKLKIEEQQRIIQASSNRYANSKDTKLSRQLENELQLERERNDTAMEELQEKKKQIHSLKLDLDHTNRSLQETKQQLRNKSIECDQLLEENEDLRVNNENMGTMIENIRQLQDENDELINEVQDREQEIEALESEVVKLLSHLEKKEGERGIDPQEQNERILNLEEALQEREEDIEMLKNELKSINESHDNDIEAFEEHIAKIQEEIERKDQQNKEIVLELEESKREFEEMLEKQYNDLIIKIRDREVRLATMEGNFEAKTDTMQRERELMLEEMQEWKEKYAQLKENKDDLRSIRDDSERQRFAIQSDRMSDSQQQQKMIKLEAKLKDSKQKQLKMTDQVNKQAEQIRMLRHKLFDETQRKTNNDSSERGKESSKLNRELQLELEERDRIILSEKKKAERYLEDLERERERSNQLKKQLERRDTMLTNSLLARDSLKEQGERMENILYEQATGGHSFRDRTDSAMSSF